MQLSVPEKTVRLRTMAAQLRAAAARTAQDDYRAKFEGTARDLEDFALRLEQEEAAAARNGKSPGTGRPVPGPDRPLPQPT